jgi:hypothetical protein
MTDLASAPPDGLLTLEAGGTLVALDPALGGRVTRLRLAGRDWLAPGGIEETLTFGAATAEHLADAVTTLAADGSVRIRADTPGRPYAYERTLTVEPDGDVRADYALISRADAPLPLHWSARPRLPLVPSTRLDLPIAARMRVLGERDLTLGGSDALHRWPVLRVGGRDATPFGPREVDFTFPALAPRRFGEGGRAAYGCVLLMDLPRPSGGKVRLGVEQDGARLELVVDSAAVPLVTLWIDAVDGGAGTIAIGPTAGPPPGRGVPGGPASDSPNAGPAAAGDGAGPAITLAPGETRRWSVVWRGRAAPASA